MHEKIMKILCILGACGENRKQRRKILKIGQPSFFLYFVMTYFLQGVRCMSCKVGHPIQHIFERNKIV